MSFNIYAEYYQPVCAIIKIIHAMLDRKIDTLSELRLVFEYVLPITNNAAIARTTGIISK
jgi:hypothetical protein